MGTHPPWSSLQLFLRQRGGRSHLPAGCLPCRITPKQHCRAPCRPRKRGAAPPCLPSQHVSHNAQGKQSQGLKGPQEERPACETEAGEGLQPRDRPPNAATVGTPTLWYASQQSCREATSFLHRLGACSGGIRGERANPGREVLPGCKPGALASQPVSARAAELPNSFCSPTPLHPPTQRHAQKPGHPAQD